MLLSLNSLFLDGHSDAEIVLFQHYPDEADIPRYLDQFARCPVLGRQVVQLSSVPGASILVENPFRLQLIAGCDTIRPEGASQMLPTLKTGCFLIADISGYTGFLANVELDHANDIVIDLMETTLRELRPPFHLAKLEGDAAFLYVLHDSVDGSAVQDAIESAYFAFRRRLRNIKHASVCECQACARMGDLDFKYVSHVGDFVIQETAGNEELAGRDVIIVHRLLKNSVNERFGKHAYVLYSDACVSAMDLDPKEQALEKHNESIDLIGDVRCWVGDLEAAWIRENEKAINQVSSDNAFGVLEFDIAASRQTVWDYFTKPQLRPLWRGADEVREETVEGRRGIGTVNHCVHGDQELVEEILDWRPFDYLTLTTLLPVPKAPLILMSYVFSEAKTSDDREPVTHIEIRIAPPAERDRNFFEHAGAEFEKVITGEIAALKLILKESGSGQGVVDEAELPESEERFLTEPV